MRTSERALALLRGEGARLVLAGLVCLLFVMLTFNRGVYVTLYAAALLGLALLYVNRKAFRPADWALPALPLLFFFYVAITPGAWFKDMPTGETMFLSYAAGLGVAAFCGGRVGYAAGSLFAGLTTSLILFVLRGFPQDMVWNGRLALFFDHPAVLSFIAGAVFLYFMDRMGGRPGSRKWPDVAACAVCLGIVVFCSSRGTYLALLTGSGFLTLFVFRRYAARIFLALAVSMGILFMALPQQHKERLFSAVEHPLQDATFVSRQPIWDAAVAGFEASPWWGNGLRAFHSFHGRFITANAESLAAKYPVVEKNIANPHNSYVGLLFGYGIIGAALFVLILLPAVGMSFASRRYLFPAIVLFYMTYGLFDYPLHRKDGILLLFFPLGVVYGRRLASALQRKVPAEQETAR